MDMAVVWGTENRVASLRFPFHQPAMWLFGNACFPRQLVSSSAQESGLTLTCLLYAAVQIAHAEEIKEGLFSSFVQMRGSIPTFWTQDTSKYTPKPDIVISRVDPMYSATQVGFYVQTDVWWLWDLSAN